MTAGGRHMIPDPQRIADSPLGVGLVAALGRLPVRLGHPLAGFVADQIAGRRQARMVRAVRANQWVVRGELLETQALDRAVRETFRDAARSLFDVYHYRQDPEAARRLIVLDSTARQLIQRPEFDGRGLMVAGLHMSGSDLVLQWLCREGMKPLVLTLPDPQGGRRTEYEMRRRTGMNLVPASMSALRQALRYLQQGGLVLTGIDRPVPEPGTRPRFFGRPAALPVHHIYLAARARIPVLVMAANLQADGRYHIVTSDPIEMEPDPDREVQTLRNAEKVLRVAEGFIRTAPWQWSVSLPVWPETLDLVPG